jgi:hypothetical protein
MVGEKRYYRIPILTRLFGIEFYIYWQDGRFKRIGFKKNTMTLEEAITRLERKRLYREKYLN